MPNMDEVLKKKKDNKKFVKKEYRAWNLNQLLNPSEIEQSNDAELEVEEEGRVEPLPTQISKQSKDKATKEVESPLLLIG